ncbi:hypothetical protein K437DRAFT_42912 [Tilletiaria anomala UBC 951]|uniref:Uncharacterized protein n=1 Tax=Tilletiaria anomala (strain ATCC 24038 / CBS 436.72 / UBC 951) TaxID=1037660 RepID=A0A066V6Y6_TILAU|nr:uncharacterized protein K437DRAFT_42912 [Tilletiaria anomala UBC 951]KDN37236.1 hypothetical protein K437DRAFT_42912 [Tilletiaria anomala UBC 951]
MEGRLKRRFEKHPSANTKGSAKGSQKVIAFSNGQRLLLQPTNMQLTAFLEHLNASSPEPTLGAPRCAPFAAYSMGGALFLHSRSACPNHKIFGGIAFTFTPFSGMPNILGALSWDDNTRGRNDIIYKDATSLSFRSTFFLLPHGVRGCRGGEKAPVVGKRLLSKEWHTRSTFSTLPPGVTCAFLPVSPSHPPPQRAVARAKNSSISHGHLNMFTASLRE